MRQGQVVINKKGRDTGKRMVVLAVETEARTGALYLSLADGSTRTLSKPKKKKAKHVQPTHTIVDFSCVGPRGLQDADIRKMLGEEVSPLGEG